MKTLYQKMANLAVNYAVFVKKGDRVLIAGSEVANDLMREIYTEAIKAGGYPTILSQVKGTTEAFYQHASNEQLLDVNPITKLRAEGVFNKQINIFADYNTRKMQLISPEKIKIAQSGEEAMKYNKIYREKVTNGEIDWTIVPFPCDSFAQDAGMDLNSYTNFIISSLKLDSADPAEAWRETERDQKRIVDYLSNADKIQIIGEDTDITLSTKGRRWANSCGHKNLPDGEVYTSPIENSVNGKIRFTYPGIYQGKEIENIYLEFKDGVVVKGTADKGQDLLETILSIENANRLGEVAVGTNYGITHFTKNMLFDEKMGGTIHMALGFGFGELGSQNISAIHWDILKDMKTEDSKIFVDGTLIYQAGKWLI